MPGAPVEEVLKPAAEDFPPQSLPVLTRHQVTPTAAGSVTEQGTGPLGWRGGGAGTGTLALVPRREPAKEERPSAAQDSTSRSDRGLLGSEREFP